MATVTDWMDGKGVLEVWNNIRERYEKQAKKNLVKKFKSTENTPRLKLIEAVAFWTFIKDKLWKNSWGLRLEFFSYFLGDDNTLVALVAHIESLPDKIWRRILEAHNIDFSSCEAFLRRIEPEQIQAIYDNYQDLVVDKKLPRIYRGFDSWFFTASYGELYDTMIEYDVRYLSKGAKCDDMLGLHFGFNKYPFNGDQIDTVKCYHSITEKLSDFFAFKEHAEGFVVDWQYGHYGRMYRGARKNHVYTMRSAHNTDNKHFCPGFYFTMIFWISMLASLVSCLAIVPFVDWQTASLFKMIVILICSAATPLYIALTILKSCALFCWRQLTKIPSTRFSRWLGDVHRKTDYDVIKIIAGFVILLGTMTFFGWITWSALALQVGKTRATIFISIIPVYIASKIIYSNHKIVKFNYLPWWIQLYLLVIAEAIIVQGMIFYGDLVLDLIVITIASCIFAIPILAMMTAPKIVHFGGIALRYALLFGEINILPLLCLSGYALLISIFFLSDERQKQIFIYLERTIRLLTIIFFLSAPVLTVRAYHQTVIGELSTPIWQFVLYAVGCNVIVFGGFLLIQRMINDKGLRLAGWKDTFAAVAYKNNFDQTSILKNHWLMSGEVEFRELMSKIDDLSRRNKTLFNRIVGKVNPCSCYEIMTHHEELCKYGESRREVVIDYILNGDTYLQAICKAERALERKKAREDRAKKFKNIFSRILTPIQNGGAAIGAIVVITLIACLKVCKYIAYAIFAVIKITIWQPIKFVFLVIIGIIGSIFLGKFMKDVCPYTFRQEVL